MKPDKLFATHTDTARIYVFGLMLLWMGKTRRMKSKRRGRRLRRRRKKREKGGV